MHRRLREADLFDVDYSGLDEAERYAEVMAELDAPTCAFCGQRIIGQGERIDGGFVCVGSLQAARACFDGRGRS